MGTQNVDNSQDILDSRDIIERIEELESMKELAESGDAEFDDYADQDELDALYALQDEAHYSPDWEHGETLIRETYFEEYAQQLAEDCGMVDDSQTLSNYIDWERWANDLKYDYSAVEFDGVTYYIHS